MLLSCGGRRERLLDPGLGTLLVAAVTTRDYPVIQGLVLVFAAVVVVCSLVTDLVYLVVDPRIRL